MPTLEITRETWWQVVAACRETFQNPTWTELASLLYYGVCRASLITPTSLELFALYMRVGGIHARTPEEFGRLPVFWTNAVDIIEDEAGNVRKQKWLTRRQS